MSSDDSLTRALPELPDRVWTATEWEYIQYGYQAQGMDEKWDVYAEGDRVFLHRSWTGILVYEAVFTPVPDGGLRITEAYTESDPPHSRGMSDTYHRIVLELVISAIVLGEPALALREQLMDEIVPGAGPGDATRQAALHSVLGLV